MNNQIFIEYDNKDLEETSSKLYDLFIQNGYNAILLDSNMSLNNKINIIKDSTNKVLIISNKINNNANQIELVYPLRSTDNLALSIYNKLTNQISKYYQLRSNSNTRLDYYEILRNINNNEAIIIKYGVNTLNNNVIINTIYQAIIGYLNNENIYIVKSGDSLYSIARKFNTTVDEIKRVNNLSTNNLSINQRLIIPSNNQNNNNNNENIYIVKSGDSLYSIARKYNTTVNEIKKMNNLTTNNLSINQRLIIPSNNENNNQNNNNNNENIYIVKSGDSLYSIAKKFNTTVDEIKRINNLTTNNLSINQKLIIPQ